MDEPAEGDPAAIADRVAAALADGGCALVVRNTVGRAQQAYIKLRDLMGSDVLLLHSRLTVGERADRTAQALTLLGPTGPQGAQRPRRLVVVATQLAEQSFDVDCDLLVSDLAPIDLLLQRIGRLHRHDRPAGIRPARVARPQVIVTGLARQGSGPPRFPYGSAVIYGEHLLLRAAALAEQAAAGAGWLVPADVPALVERGYDSTPLVPGAWAQAAGVARLTWEDRQRTRAARAAGFLLAGEDQLGRPSLAGLHDRPAAGLENEDEVAAVVRDGDESVEVVLVQRDESGYRALDGRSLGPNGDGISDDAVLEVVLRCAVRLPPRPEISVAAKAELEPLPAWAGDPWLRHARALVLDPGQAASLGGWRLSYDAELGLTAQREGRR
jgi:CRISPR-associated endonuclease/helicase Cas3